MSKLPFLRVSYDTYVRDISIVFLLLLPLIICNVVSIFFGYLFRSADLHQLASKLFYFSDLLIGIYPIALCVITTYYLSIKKSISSVLVLPYSLVMLMAVSLPNGLVSPNTGLPNQPIIALFSAGISALWCSFSQLRYLDPSRVDFARSVYKQVCHFLGFVLIIALMSKLIEFILYKSDFISEGLRIDPLTFSGGLFYQFILGVLGAVGINGHNFLFTIKQNLYEQTQQNILLWQESEVPLNILSQGFYDSFLAIGGSGNSLSLLLCILIFSNDRRHITLAFAAIPLVMFNINELLLFGLPIIFNPTLMAPFILVPLASFVLVYSAIAIGFVNPVGAIVDWMTPPLLSGYLATQNSICGIILQLLIIVMGIFIYRPFYLHFSGRNNVLNNPAFNKIEVERSHLNTYLGDLGDTMTSSVDKHEAGRRVNKMLSKGHFVMYYQPQVDLKNPNNLVFESLIRYQDEQGKIMSPHFIDDFFLLNAIQYLDKRVIDLVLEDIQHLNKEQQIPAVMSINISTETISDQNFVNYLSERLAFYGVSPHAIEIEITEEAILDNEDIVNRAIEQLHLLGVKIAIDDFGAGFASFPHLLKYNFDKVKLDRSLLLKTSEDKGKKLYQLLAHITELTGCVLVSEGVETKGEKEFVESCGISICQGYFFSKPLSLTALQHWLEQVRLKKPYIQV